MKKRKHTKKKKKHLTANMKIQKPSLNDNNSKNVHGNFQQPPPQPPPPQQQPQESSGQESKSKKHSKSHSI